MEAVKYFRSYLNEISYHSLQFVPAQVMDVQKLPSVIPFVNVTVDENSVENGAAKILQEIRSGWPLDQVRFKVCVFNRDLIVFRSIFTLGESPGG